MSKETRMVEMYVGTGTDFGTWYTTYVDVPIDTPDDKMEEAGKQVLYADKVDFVFAGVYCILDLTEQPDAEFEDLDDD